MRVLVADTFERSGLDALEAGGCEVVYRPEAVDDAMSAALRDTRADVLIVRSTPVTARMLDVPSLSLIVRAGAGYNTIDVAAASARGIYVSNCPGKNAAAVAELAFGLILALDRRIPESVVDLRAGVWNKKEYSKARGLAGRTLGLLGFGHIGHEMAQRARGFEMPIVVWSRRFTKGSHEDPGPDVRLAATPEAVAEAADVLSVHLALTAETRGLVGRSLLEKMRPGSLLINTARSEIVDVEALAAIAPARNLRVGLDVYRNEPESPSGSFSDPVAKLPFVYGTHHIGASTEQAQEAIAAETVRIVLEFKATGRVPNVVNLARTTPATHTLVVRHRDRPGVLAHVFERLRADGLNAQESENVVFEGAEAASARISVDREPSPALVASIKNGNADIIDVQVIKIQEY